MTQQQHADDYDPLARAWGQEASIDTQAPSHLGYEELDLGGYHHGHAQSHSQTQGSVLSHGLPQAQHDSRHQSSNQASSAYQFGQSQYDSLGPSIRTLPTSIPASIGSPSYPEINGARHTQQPEVKALPVSHTASQMQPQLREGTSLVCIVGPASKVTGNGNILGVDTVHWEYAVTTRTTLMDWPAQEITVRRRFRDFVALSDLLYLTLPGYFLPQRPHRNQIATRRATSRFMERRRQLLERYLNRLASHPEASSSPVFKVFLQAEGTLASSHAWQVLRPAHSSILSATTRLLRQIAGSQSTVPAPTELTRTASQAGDVRRAVKEQITMLQGKMKNMQVTPLESRLREEASKQEDLRVSLTKLAHASSILVSKLQAVSDAQKDLGAAFASLAAYEETFGYATGRCESRAGEGLARIAEVTNLGSNQTQTQLLAITEQAEGIHVAQAAMGVRERALLSFLTLDLELSSKQSQLDTANSTGPAGFNRAQSLTNAVDSLQAAAGAAKEEYTRLADRNASEFVRWKVSLQRDLLECVRGVATMQATTCQRSHQLWSETAVGLRQPKPAGH